MNSTTADPSIVVRRRASIVSHPWFPKAIGVWFAALFGLSSLAVAPEVLERIVTALGIDRIVPAAAPPLGQTARLLLAMGMSIVGEIVGLVIGARLAGKKRPPSGDWDDAAPTVRAKDRHPDAPPRKILSALDDLREDDSSPKSDPDLASAAWQAPASEKLAEPLPAPETPPSRAFIDPHSSAAVAVASASLDSLGVVQLSERLALALQARRERQGAARGRDERSDRATAPVAVLAAPVDQAAAEPDTTDLALSAALASLQRISGAR
jgi:hypothetical protein